MKFLYLFLISALSLCYSTPSLNWFLLTKNHAKVLMNKYSRPRWELGKNKFFNLDEKEFSVHKGYWNSYKFPKSTYIYDKNQKLPGSWDWRDHGIVGPVKDQAQCGSCWAFSAVGALESQIMKLTNKNVSLSEQEMVDCVVNITSPDGSIVCCDGCMGGEMYSVYQYLMKDTNGTDDTEKQYPYEATDQNCQKVLSIVKTKVKKFVSLPVGDEKAMLHALYTVGPLSIGVDANSDWQLYDKGIYNPTNETCDPDILDHGVVLVGYGTEKKLNYWIIRNSWGKDWGEKGYIRLTRGTNACGVANAVIYPIVEN